MATEHINLFRVDYLLRSVIVKTSSRARLLISRVKRVNYWDDVFRLWWSFLHCNLLLDSWVLFSWSNLLGIPNARDSRLHRRRARILSPWNWAATLLYRSWNSLALVVCCPSRSYRSCLSLTACFLWLLALLKFLLNSDVRYPDLFEQLCLRQRGISDRWDNLAIFTSKKWSFNSLFLLFDFLLELYENNHEVGQAKICFQWDVFDSWTLHIKIWPNSVRKNMLLELVYRIQIGLSQNLLRRNQRKLLDLLTSLRGVQILLDTIPFHKYFFVFNLFKLPIEVSNCF